MPLSELLVAAADRIRKYRWFQAIAQSPLFFTLKDEVLKTFLTEFAGFPVDIGIRPILRLRQARSTPAFKISRPAEGSTLRLLLVQPPLPSNRRHKVIIPYGLACIAAQVRRDLPDVQVAVLDALALDYDEETTFNAIKSQEWDVIGFSAMTSQIDFAYGIADRIRQEGRKTEIWFGGVHPTLCPEEALSHGDAVIIGEGEETVLELISTRLSGKPAAGVPGTVVNTAAGIVRGPARPLIADLDALAFPAYDLLPIRLYNNPLHVVGGERLPIFASRGCPYSCSFCNSPQIWHRKVRFRSAENVLAEVDWIMKTFGIRQFHFWDDNITLKPELIADIAKGFEERGNIRWVGLDRAEHIVAHADLLPLFKRSGCVGIELGVESVNPETFDYIHKGQGFEDVRGAVRLQKEAGLAPLYTCMAFNPGETISGYRLQKIFLDQIQSGLPWYAFFHQLSFPIYLGQFATPYPGTPFGNDRNTLGEDLAEGYHHRHHQYINFVPNSLLDDIPAMLHKPNRDDMLMFLTVAMTGLWGWFDGHSDMHTAAAHLRRIYFMTRRFLDAIDGGTTVSELADKVSSATAEPRRETVQVIALACYVFGQIGRLGSSGHQTPEAQGAPEKITIPKYYSRLVGRLSRRGGFSDDLSTMEMPPRLPGQHS
ncbi:MAG TPA: radical SAM protein [Candidatus Ozemobacteraceae bacterium]|nr:radical SAM protein [Candidatus Ozemobacteraceae bacterium]